uniref:Uncharacterized protein n=1 Tax=Aegilops tauschii subsp. strangulata TaxID=200361 RepID=A0A452ZC83_AEGTS
SSRSQARRPVPPPRRRRLLPPSARACRVRVRGRRRGGGAGQGGLAEAQDHRRLLHPRGQRGGLRHPVAGPEVPCAEPGQGPLLRRQGLRGGGHPRHLLRAHPPGGLRAARLAVPRQRAVAEVPVRRPRRHARGHRHARRRHHRHGLLPARRARQEGCGRRRGRRRGGHVGSSRARRSLPRRVSRRRVIGGGVRRRRRAAHPPACHLAGADRCIHSLLELGIIVHSVIIGMSLGASQSTSTIRPLVVALTFHQFFEGIGLGGCIVQAKFRLKSVLLMALFFSLTTPVGVVIGIGISSVYDENSPNTLIIQGILSAAAAGILNYMALVDLLAEDFMNPRVQGNGRLQVIVNLSLLLGTGLMSMLAIWA